MVSSITLTNTLEYIQALWIATHQMGLPIALWRLPETQEIQGIIDLSGQPQKTVIDLEELHSGFAVSPFINPEADQSLFIHADIHFTLEQDPSTETYIFSDKNLPLNDPILQIRKENFYQTLENILQTRNYSSVISSRTSYQTQDADQAIFEDMVSKAIREMEEGKFQKVVLSRTITVPIKEDTNIIQTYFKLTQSYPLAFVSLISIPEHGTWMGASPEVIISTNKQKIFRTIALAGTQPYEPGVPLSEVMWKQKEIEEQALVSRYIINCFKKIRLREFEEEGPKTVVAGNLLHLRTDLTVDMQATQFPQLGTVMLRLLHPTSAVCGTPKEPAMDFISNHEPHNREFYSGFLGPVNIDGESHLFVNLRCTQWLSNRVIFYAGAGITTGSIPEREWRETELKTQTMRKIVGV
ncbi:chorismate-binding protein [Cytophagaceae bacterium DM2B3-1]|uniref:isochorismate synthase n=1 Tax=Xanthocytophaga flava TaxID=3048013 RepID=A0ABT7CX65_9BACT|nr:chorismate-binding protein [Xanthocytophaga flavus]MDJ1498363.1 chorismate-binding protein [Xanthocytophaga flavus]